VICSFDGKDPTDESNQGALPMLSRRYLLKKLLVVHSTKALPGRKLITPIPIPISSSLPASLHGYLILIPNRVSNEIEWPEPIPAHFSEADMLYIDSYIREVAQEDSLISIDDDDSNT
jgi:hypothetical protein